MRSNARPSGTNSPFHCETPEGSIRKQTSKGSSLSRAARGSLGVGLCRRGQRPETTELLGGASPTPPTLSGSGPHRLPGRTLGTGAAQPTGSVAAPKPGRLRGRPPQPSRPGAGPRAVTCEGTAAPPHPPRGAAPRSPGPAPRPPPHPLRRRQASHHREPEAHGARAAASFSRGLRKTPLRPRDLSAGTRSQIWPLSGVAPPNSGS